jgi:hypothetical protein
MQVGPPPATRKVDRLSCIRYASARYSVPTRLIGTTVTLVQDAVRLLNIEPCSVEVVADHRIAAPVEGIVLDEHYGGPRLAPNRDARPNTAVEKRFCEVSETTEQFLIGAAAIGNTRLSSELDTLLALGGTIRLPREGR